MVVSTNMGWLTELSNRVGGHLRQSLTLEHKTKRPNFMGILAFETAKIMSRLVSLYRSLSEDEIDRLRYDLVRSDGVMYLNSHDEGYLLSLACAERLEDLDKAASAVARFGHRCHDLGLNSFDVVYSDLKLGIIDFRKLDYGSKESEKKVKKMEKLIAATSSLYASLEILSEMETSEMKLIHWQNTAPLQLEQAHLDHFYEKLDYQRRQVRHYKEISLWSKTFDKIVGLMGLIVCIVYARIYTVFGPYVPIIPGFSVGAMRSSKKICFSHVQPEFAGSMESIMASMTNCSRSGPIHTTPRKTLLIRFYSRRSVFFMGKDDEVGAEKVFKNEMVFQAAGPSTVGGAGLGLRYANVILLAERCMNSGEWIDEHVRDGLYKMLPENLKTAVRSKLIRNMRDAEEDEFLAEGWREALKDIMRWLAPMAHDTITWQLERNVEKMKFDWKPSVLLLQTLHFADKEKTEAAIAEVLVALSCIYRFENRQLSDDEF